jgi:nucleotide sugar dehydrogenase
MPIDRSGSSSKCYTIAVVGLGKIGLPLATQYAKHGHKVIGCDTNTQVVENLNMGIAHVQEEPELALEVSRLVREGRLSATSHTTEAVRAADVVVVIVPVVIDADHKVNSARIDAATTAIGEGLQPGTLIIYETTLPVGTTSHHLRSLLELSAGLHAGSDFYLAYSPERVSSRSIFHDLHAYPKVVGGINEESTFRAIAFYHAVLDAEIITMASTDEAEFVKLIETTYRDVNIALANEYACYADIHGLNVLAAIAAANTQPYSHIHAPGVGVGGHCIPVYPYFLFTNPYDTPQQINTCMLALPRQARRINDEMAEYAVQRMTEATGPLHSQAVLILGVAYRGDVHETAFTSAKLLQEALKRRGARVYVNDPLFSESELQSLGYTPLLSGEENKVDAIILQSNHSIYQTFDFRCFKNCKTILDGRQWLDRASIEALGIRYIAIGDGHYENTNSMLSKSPVKSAMA